MTEETKEKEAEVTESQQAEEAEQLLPDGIGLSVEEVRAMLQKKHETYIPPDDPYLMNITIMNAVLTEQAKLQKKYSDALASMLSVHSDRYIKSTTERMNEVMKTLSVLTTEGINKAVQDMVQFKTTMLICTAISFLSAALIVGVFVLKGA